MFNSWDGWPSVRYGKASWNTFVKVRPWSVGWSYVGRRYDNLLYICCTIVIVQQSVGHSVCKYTNQIVVKLCLNFYTMEYM